MTFAFGNARCPHCGYRVDSVAPVSQAGAVPKDGDLSVCVQCTGPAAFTRTPFGLALRELTAAEIADVDADDDYRAAVRMLRQRL